MCHIYTSQNPHYSNYIYNQMNVFKTNTDPVWSTELSEFQMDSVLLDAKLAIDILCPQHLKFWYWNQFPDQATTDISLPMTHAILIFSRADLDCWILIKYWAQNRITFPIRFVQVCILAVDLIGHLRAVPHTMREWSQTKWGNSM